jgi:hypothetical protein
VHVELRNLFEFLVSAEDRGGLSETHIDVGRCSHKDPIYKTFLVCELLVNIRFVGVIIVMYV